MVAAGTDKVVDKMEFLLMNHELKIPPLDQEDIVLMHLTEEYQKLEKESAQTDAFEYSAFGFEECHLMFYLLSFGNLLTLALYYG